LAQVAEIGVSLTNVRPCITLSSDALLPSGVLGVVLTSRLGHLGRYTQSCRLYLQTIQGKKWQKEFEDEKSPH